MTQDRISVATFRHLAKVDTKSVDGSTVVSTSPATVKETGGVRRLLWCISSDSVDRMGDVIKVAGWDLTNYQKGGSVLWAHDSNILPVAKPIRTYTQGNKLWSVAEYPTKEENAFADSVYLLAKGGYLRGASIGMRPKAWEFAADRVSDQYPAPINFLEQELLEWSHTPIPANPEALISAKSMIDLSPIRSWAEKALDENLSITGISREQLEKAYAMTSPNVTRTVGRDPSKYAKTDSQAWDGPKEVAAADTEDLKKMCAWYDGNEPDVKSSYKLPHHKAKDYTLVFAGVKAAMAALLGARGGTDIPESERKGVYNHLAAHYKEFDAEPPEYHKDTEVMTTKSMHDRAMECNYAMHNLIQKAEDMRDAHKNGLLLKGYVKMIQGIMNELMSGDQSEQGLDSHAGEKSVIIREGDPNNMQGEYTASTDQEGSGEASEPDETLENVHKALTNLADVGPSAHVYADQQILNGTHVMAAKNLLDGLVTKYPYLNPAADPVNQNSETANPSASRPGENTDTPNPTGLVHASYEGRGVDRYEATAHEDLTEQDIQDIARDLRAHFQSRPKGRGR